MKVYWIGRSDGFTESGNLSYIICWITNSKRITSCFSEASVALQGLRDEWGEEFKYELFEEEV